MPAIRPLATLDPPCNARAWHSTPHPRLPILATSCADKTVRIYSLQNFAQQSRIAGGHKRSIRCAAWKPHGVGESVLATGSFDASAGIWRRREQGEGISSLPTRETDFTTGLAGGGEDADDDEDEEWKFAVILDGHDSEIKSVAFAPTAPLLATCSRDKSVWIWEELDDDNFETVAVLQEHEGDVKCVAWHPSEGLLASGSYDDNIRLWREDVDDWACCSLLSGHEGTVWWVEFEGETTSSSLRQAVELTDEQNSLLEARAKAGPALISCSDDSTIRVWRRKPRDRPHAPDGQDRMPSIWKNRDFEEEWVQSVALPQSHDGAVYAVTWSRRTGLVASTGNDGKIVVYEEKWKGQPTAGDPNGDIVLTDGTGPTSNSTIANDDQMADLAEWVAVAELDNAHDVFEINHITWAPRADKGRRYDHEEILVTTGDDGAVKLWTLDR